MELADTIAGYVLLGGLFGIFTIMNYRLLFMRIKKVERIPSPAPFIGGAAGAMLVYIVFRQPLLILLPLIIDPGSIPLLIWFFICLISDLVRKE